MLNLSGSRISGSGILEDNYSECSDPRGRIISRRPKGVGGVITPNGLSNKELDEYVKERSGEVKTYRLEDLKNEPNNDLRSK